MTVLDTSLFIDAIIPFDHKRHSKSIAILKIVQLRDVCLVRSPITNYTHLHILPEDPAQTSPPYKGFTLNENLGYRNPRENSSHRDSRLKSQ